jgi:hypothetical protein
MDHQPNVCSIPPAELIEFCEDQGGGALGGGWARGTEGSARIPVQPRQQ